MATEKLSRFQVLVCRADDLVLGAAGVGDERAFFGMQVAERVHDAADGLGEIEQVGPAAGFFGGDGGVDGADGRALWRWWRAS